MNDDERLELQDSLRRFERLHRGPLGELDESDIAISLVGGVLLARDTAIVNLLRAMEAMVPPSSGTPYVRVDTNAWHQIAFSPTIGGSNGTDRPFAAVHGRSSDMSNRTGSDQSDLSSSTHVREGRSMIAYSGLTESELRVAELVALGLTNREVGQQMFLSRHTIDSHLRHVFDKLGIKSRVQLARLAFAPLQRDS